MPAEQAARIILDGVVAGKGRILVSSDAKTIDRCPPSASTSVATSGSEPAE
jgi:hypothetical protein